MVSKATDSASKSRKSYGGQGSDTLGTITYRINQLKKKIQADRVLSIREKVEDNRNKIESHVSELVSLVASRENTSFSKECGSDNMLSARIEVPLCTVCGIVQGSGDREYVNGEEVVASMVAKLPLVEKIPPYTTWIFLDRNQRMAEDQSVVGKRRIYYDPHGSEALICSDSEEETIEPEEEKHDFSEGEDRILRMTFTDYGLDGEVLKILSQFIGGTTSEIQEHCNMLKEMSLEVQNKDLNDSGESESEGSVFHGKSLSAALDSFDNLFCRRCLVFDCRLHGCSQLLISASEKQFHSSDSEDSMKPCSTDCYLRLRVEKSFREGLESGSFQVSESKTSEENGSPAISPDARDSGKRRASEPLNTVQKNSVLVHNDPQESCIKKMRPSVPDEVNMALEDSTDEVNMALENSTDEVNMALENSTDEVNMALEDSLFMDHDLEIRASDENQTINDASNEFGLVNSSGKMIEKDEGRDIEKTIPVVTQVSNSKGSSEWKPLEKELYLKGIEMFGRNSCLIARNLLSGLKTCIEVSSYMNGDGAAMPRGPAALTSSSPDDNGRTDMDNSASEIPSRSRLLRKKGRTRKLKYSWKSAGHPSIWRRIADGKNQSCKQYTPCGCQSMCGKQCPCLLNETCCEKYCGCSKSCKNRFRGCHCAKSQCRSRQCPCFAAGRECDPDVCRNCWVSCGDGSLGEPPRRGDGQCGNMRLLLRQQQRILLAKSDVAGWGAFLKNPVNKNDYLGEYTGELISHREADKRGKIYDRANSSFLFDLNDQYVLDAYRKGDKLKFANHSSNPNCYAKVMLVSGDHRVGIFAKEHIEACEELFYDYRYGPDQAPIWARNPEGSKRDDSPVPQGRAKKHTH